MGYAVGISVRADVGDAVGAIKIIGVDVGDAVVVDVGNAVGAMMLFFSLT